MIIDVVFYSRHYKGLIIIYPLQGYGMVESISVGASPYAELFDPVGVIFITIINTIIEKSISAP